jgi:hypothetical protein
VNVTLGSGPLLLSDGPGLYANDMECVWLVEAAGPITVVFKTLRTERYTDYVQISEGTGDDAVHRVFDGLELPPAISTNATRMTVKFHSDSSGRFSGFELELYSLVPGGTWAPSGAPTTRWAPDAGPDSVVFQCDGTSDVSPSKRVCVNGTLSWSCEMDCAGATCEISLSWSGLRGPIPAGLGDVRCANEITKMCVWARPVPPAQPRSACARSAAHLIVLRAQRPLRERCADRRGAGECREAAKLE